MEKAARRPYAVSGMRSAPNGRTGRFPGGGQSSPVQDNEIVGVTSPHGDTVIHGNRCIQGRFGYQHVQNRG